MEAVDEAWAGAVQAELRRLRPGRAGEDLARSVGLDILDLLPLGYRQQTGPVEAAWDLATGSSLGGTGPGSAGTGLGQMTLAPCLGDAPGDFRLRRAGRRRAELSSWLPVLDSFGLVVVESVPWHFAGVGGEPGFYVDDIGLRLVEEAGPNAWGQRLIEAIGAVASGRGEVGPLNSLVVSAGLDWREINLLSAYCHYRRQAGGLRAVESAEAMARALVLFPATAAATVALFQALLGTAGDKTRDDKTRDDKAERVARDAVEGALAVVPDLEHDDALHELVEMVEATTRSNWASGAPVIAVKLDSTRLAFLPVPRPFAEIYVWSTWFEGLHLRFGPVARGGVRWSERASDLRGEVLSLARAQVKKNSLIVPTGAKGAFYLRQPAGQADVTGREDQPGRTGVAREAYAAFIGALLDLTDNIVDGSAVHPPIVCRDGDDPYLVVAADKGTARFSDLANSISTDKGFWLGDAFASGGSNGYDHKALGITAKGAWLAVRRHFRALGMDADNDQLRVAGVGDMSGDVFGNGVLQSRHIELIAAFDHRHIFVDPSPAPEASFAERERLAQLRASSWADYDMSKASPGAGVYPRHSKHAQLSPQARAALGAATEELAPPELVKTVLKAPVDLLFFGGIGTFARGPGENDVDIEDHANDDVRLDAKDLRARVIAEGANLALTEQARAAYSRRGGRVNADFVDNAAGVALSDREVNMKVLLGTAVAAGRVAGQRTVELLAMAQDEASAQVLAQVDAGIVALDKAASARSDEMPAYESLLRDLEAEGLLDRHVEALPDDEELARRAQAGAGFSRPELAVLVAYARSELARDIERSPFSRGGDLDDLVLGYFPVTFRQGLEDLVVAHPLARQLAASQLANEMLQYMGPAWAHESASETGRALHEVAAAYWVARQVLGAQALMARLAAEGAHWSLEAEEGARDTLAATIARLARWCLVHPGPFRADDLIAADGPFADRAAELVVPDEALRASLAGQGVPSDVVDEVVRAHALGAVGELGSVSRNSGRPLEQAAQAVSALAERLSIGALNRGFASARPCERWDRRQLHLLTDDLARALAMTAVSALGAFPGQDGQGAVDNFLAGRPKAFSRYRLLAQEVAGSSQPNLSLLAVVTRCLVELGQGPAELPPAP